MDNIGDEYKHYWETNMFLQTQELDNWGLDEAFSGYYDSSSPDGGQSSSSPASKNIVSERNRRKRLNERLFALRAVVPNISKMDKASIIKDAINYIEELHEQERIIKEEISELESGKLKKPKILGFDGDDNMDDYENDDDEDEDIKNTTSNIFSISKKNKRNDDFGGESRSSPIEILELRLSYMREKTVVVSLTCNKRRDTMVKLCKVFETLNLKVITANITAFSHRISKTLFIQADEEEKELLKRRIENAITALNDPESSMNT